MSDRAGDPVTAATMRLEAAVERLARAAAAAKAAQVPAGGVSKEAVAALAGRLEQTIARLRDVLGEDGQE